MDLNFVEYNSFANIENNEMCITLVVFGCINEEAINYNPNANTDDGSCYLSLVEIFTVGMANGGMEFTPAILGLGNEYELFWTFDNGTTSSEQNPIIFFEENGTYEIILVVNNGVIEVEASIFVDILNAGLGLNEVTNQKQVVSIKYYDIMGREIIYLNRSQNYIYIQKTLYKDGSYEHLKMIKTL